MTQADTVGVILAELQAQEELVWQALVAGDAAADRALLHADFLGVYPDGFAGREDHAAQLAAGPSVAEYRLSTLRLLVLGAEHALLCYRADYTRTGAVAPETMFVSSLWQRQEAGWINLFSQDTRATRDA